MVKTIKIIDLLNKIANDEEVPDKIKYQGVTLTLEEGVYYAPNEMYSLIDYIKLKERNLNDTVEIIEEDNKIEYIEYELIAQCDNWLKDERGNFSNLKLNQYLINCIRKNTEIFGDKINEIIDEINKLKGEK